MNPYRSVTEQITDHEKLRLRPSLCNSGCLTVGYGRDLSNKGVTLTEAKIMLQNDIDEAENDCKSIFQGWTEMSAYRKWALIEMRFKLSGQFHRFVEMIRAVNLNDWQKAAKILKDSEWYANAGHRGYFIYRQLIGNSDGL